MVKAPHEKDASDRFLPINAGSAIAYNLRQRILQGELKPKSRLNLRETAAEYGISYMPARDAVRELIRDGLAVQQGTRTVIVAPMTEEDMIDIMELRLALEPRALALSIPHLTAADMRKIEDILRRPAQPDHPLSFVEAHHDFHMALYSRAGRRHLLAVIAQIHRQRYLALAWAHKGVQAEWAKGEAELFAHVKRRDIEGAVDFLKKDLEATLRRILKSYPGHSDRTL